MSAILEKIKESRKLYRISAIKEKNSRAKIKARVLTTLIGELETKQKGGKGELSDVKVVELTKKFVNDITETLAVCHDDDLLIEMEALNVFIPRQVTGDEIESEVSAIVEGWESPLTMKDMGKIMGILKNNHGAALDTAVASTVVKGIIAQSA